MFIHSIPESNALTDERGTRKVSEFEREGECSGRECIGVIEIILVKGVLGHV